MKIATILCLAIVAMTTKHYLVAAFSFLLPETGYEEQSGDFSHQGGEEGGAMSGEEADGPTTTSTATTIDLSIPDMPPAPETTLPPLTKYNDTDTEGAVTTREENLLGGGGPGEDDGLPSMVLPDFGGHLLRKGGEDALTSSSTIEDNSNDVSEADSDADEPGSYSSNGADIKSNSLRFYVGLVSASIICLVY